MLIPSGRSANGGWQRLCCVFTVPLDAAHCRGPKAHSVRAEQPCCEGSAVALSVAEMLSRVARPHDAIEGVVPGLAGMHDVDDYPRARTIPGLLVYRYDSPLFFANAEDFRRRALDAVDAQDGRVRWFVLNAEANVEVDITALDAVDALRLELTGRGIVFALARVKQDLMDDLDAYGLAEAVGRDRVFPTLPTALSAYAAWVHERQDSG